MAIFNKLALLATVALAAMVSAAPIDTTPVLHTTAPKITSSTPAETSENLVVSVQGSGFSGKGTWFTDSTGSCGTSFNSNDMIVAMNEAQMGGTSMCGKSVRITSGGKSVTARVTDTCPSQYCNSGSLDLSQAVFSQLAPLSTGVISITWEFA
ncbi:MAG: RlpA-like double-psi beta-barrel-protein domain-containing protein-containing protein [Linnemannia elongata]|nr:MAG: RlpA-like double-psi beta-barrel-protein domain-containing protein-containing protein [Linnemannia elongata]